MKNKEELLKDEKDCAVMLGMTVEEYRKNLKKTKAPAIKEKKYSKFEYDNSFLKFLGVDESILKKRKTFNLGR